MSTIEWTDATWNPTVGCSRVSAGCEHCYAERVAARGLRPEHQGLTTIGRKGPRWTGVVRFLPQRLDTPLRWRKPRRIFVDSMSDLFHEGVTDEQIDQVFAIMAATPRHTYQLLTKRPERMRAYAKRVAWSKPHDEINRRVFDLANALDGGFATWPLPNVWLGVSVEDQATADERIPLLLDTPAAVRWVSYEPALGPVDFTRLNFLPPMRDPSPHDPIVRMDALRGLVIGPDEKLDGRLDWIVVGGESGPGARPFDLAWARSTIGECRRAGVAVFFKQAGATPYESVSEARAGGIGLVLRDRKGGDLSELPADVRVREFPAGVA